jgi:hypothetical protein
MIKEIYKWYKNLKEEEKSYVKNRVKLGVVDSIVDMTKMLTSGAMIVTATAGAFYLVSLIPPKPPEWQTFYENNSCIVRHNHPYAPRIDYVDSLADGSFETVIRQTPRGPKTYKAGPADQIVASLHVDE